MKKVLKKVSAIALAFTLLGAGSIISKNVSPESDNILKANAACQYHGYSYWVDTNYKGYYTHGHYSYPKYCRCCGGFLGWTG